MSKTNNKRYSGYRIRFSPPDKQPYESANLNKLSEPLVEIVAEAMKEPYFVDDLFKEVDPAQMLYATLVNGEFFLSFWTGDDAIHMAGFMALREIVHERSAIFEAFAFPRFRGPNGKEAIYSLAKEVIEYAFDEWPKGLGLKKIKAEICADNVPALMTAEALGFRPIGMSPLDRFHNGGLYDSVLLELLNPDFFGLEPETLNDERREQGTIGTGIHAADAIPASTSVPERDIQGARGVSGSTESAGGSDHASDYADADDTGSDERGPARDGSERARELDARLLAAWREPAGSGN